MVSLCSLAMCLRTISEYRKRSPQMRQCHWSRAKMYGRHSELFGSSLGSGILIISRVGTQLAMAFIAPPQAAKRLSRRGRLRTRAASTSQSFDHLVGAGEQRVRHGESERLCGLKIDRQLVFRWLLKREIARPFAAQHTIDVRSGATV
jgi:hypothetical protein